MPTPRQSGRCPRPARKHDHGLSTARHAIIDFRQQTLPGMRLTLPFPLCSSMEDAATCPQSIIDTDPSGSGLGIWVLVGTEPGICIYEYARAASFGPGQGLLDIQTHAANVADHG
jgi:hypothetical protein